MFVLGGQIELSLLLEGDLVEPVIEGGFDRSMGGRTAAQCPKPRRLKALSAVAFSETKQARQAR